MRNVDASVRSIKFRRSTPLPDVQHHFPGSPFFSQPFFHSSTRSRKIDLEEEMIESFHEVLKFPGRKMVRPLP